MNSPFPKSWGANRSTPERNRQPESGNQTTWVLEVSIHLPNNGLTPHRLTLVISSLGQNALALNPLNYCKYSSKQTVADRFCFSLSLHIRQDSVNSIPIPVGLASEVICTSDKNNPLPLPPPQPPKQPHDNNNNNNNLTNTTTINTLWCVFKCVPTTLLTALATHSWSQSQQEPYPRSVAIKKTPPPVQSNTSKKLKWQQLLFICQQK